MTQDASFRQIVQGLRDGSPGARQELYDHYSDHIRAMVRRRLHPRLRPQYDSFDFVQEVWASFLAIPPEKYEFSDQDAFVGFLTRVAYTKVVELFRQRFQTQKYDITREQPIALRADDGSDDLVFPVADRRPSPSQVVIADEHWAAIRDRFPAGHRAVLERLREGYTQAEIAQLTGLGVRTIERIVRRLKDLCETR